MWHPTPFASNSGAPADVLLAQCQNASILRAALWSPCRLIPWSGHACQPTDKPFHCAQQLRSTWCLFMHYGQVCQASTDLCNVRRDAVLAPERKTFGERGVCGNHV